MTYGYNNVTSNDSEKKKKMAVIGVSCILLVAMVAAVAAGVSHKHKSSSENKDSKNAQVSTSMKAIQTICQPTDYKETCQKTLSSAAGNVTDPEELIKIGFKAAIEQLKLAMANSTVLIELTKDPRANQALENCKELIDYSIDDINESLSKMGPINSTKINSYINDIKVWLSGAITYEQTCIDGFENTTGNSGEKMREILETSIELTKNGLAMVSEISNILTSLNIPGIGRRLLTEYSDWPKFPPHHDKRRLLAEYSDWPKFPPHHDKRRLLTESSDWPKFPQWVGHDKRRLLAVAPANVQPDVVVAQDGSGKYKTINEALNDIPKKSNNTFVVYIKAGIYKESVMISKSMTHVTFIGDGPTKTKITGSANFVDGTPTFKTATVSVVGANFMAKDIGFENSAGAIKHQAVALRVQSDMSIFYNCQMDGYQDTLYAHTHRQFYRDCTISGTIDFIFGNAAVVFQNCTMVVRKPLQNQQCIVTAQGRIDRREPTGTILQGCSIAADPAYYPVRDENPAYLGRPWKQYSRTIIMQSQIGNFIQPQGWLPWMGDFALNTCFYSEYDNTGPGSVMTKRVTWRGVKPITSVDHAQIFTPGAFIDGDQWIKPTGVPYVSGMMPDGQT